MALRSKLFVGVLIATAAVVSVVSSQEGTCRACNCEINNVEALNQLIDAKVDARVDARIDARVDARINMTLANQPGKLKFMIYIILYEDFFHA